MKEDQTIADFLKTPRRWLVTGCAGFIGSHLTAFLLSHNQYVVGLDNLSSCGRVNLNYLTKLLPEKSSRTFTFFEGDIRNELTCKQAVKSGVDYVLHHAAIGSVKASFDSPQTTHEVNVRGFENIVSAALKNDAQKIIYASSSAVYGNSKAPRNIETQELSPLSPYAQSKIDNEHSARRLFRTHGKPIIGLRYFNIYGARQNPNGDYAAVIPKWIERGLNNLPAIIYGDGTAVRDFCYIDDIIRLNILAVMRGHNTHVYNGASGTSLAIIELERIIRESLMTNKPPIFEAPREGDIHTSIADISKAQNDLGFAAQIDIKAGIKDTINFYASKQKVSN